MSKKKSVVYQKRRSVCPIACSLDILGDKWTLLVVRDLFLGRSRFKELVVSPENPPTNILSDRLNRLLSYGIIKRVPSPDGSKHQAYQLSAKGKALKPLLDSMKDWALRWEPGTEAKLLQR